MRKVNITMMALALVFFAGNLYACGNHAKADVSSAKADIHATSMDRGCCQTVTSCDTKGAVNSTKTTSAKYMTTDYRRSPDSKNSEMKTDPLNSACIANKSNYSESSLKADVKDSKDNGGIMILMGAIDLASFYQK